MLTCRRVETDTGEEVHVVDVATPDSPTGTCALGPRSLAARRVGDGPWYTAHGAEPIMALATRYEADLWSRCLVVTLDVPCDSL